MSFPALFLVIVMAFVAASVITTDMLSARTASRTVASQAADGAIAVAQADFLLEVASVVRADADAGKDAAGTADDLLNNLPALGAAPGNASGPQTTFSAHVATSTPIDGQQPAGQNDKAQSVQTVPFVQEQRFSAIVSARISNGGPVVATRARLLTFRTFRADPYVVLDGVRELGADDAQTVAQGDAGGAASQPNDDAAPNPGDPSKYHDTSIKATGGCSSSGYTKSGVTQGPADNLNVGGNDGIAFRGQAGGAVGEYCYGAVGDFNNSHDLNWRNGSASQGGWSQ